MGRLRQRSRKRRRENTEKRGKLNAFVDAVDRLDMRTRLEVVSHTPGQKPFTVFDQRVRDWTADYETEPIDITGFGELPHTYVAGRRTFRLSADL